MRATTCLTVGTLLLAACAPTGSGRRSGSGSTGSTGTDPVAVPPAGTDRTPTASEDRRPAQVGGTTQVLSRPCDQSYTDTWVGGSVSEYRYAVFDVPDLDPSDPPLITAVLCDIESFHGGGCPNVPEECTRTGSPLPPTDCHETFFRLAPGQIVVPCGVESTWDGGDEITKSGSLSSIARIRLLFP